MRVLAGYDQTDALRGKRNPAGFRFYFGVMATCSWSGCQQGRGAPPVVIWRHRTPVTGQLLFPRFFAKLSWIYVLQISCAGAVRLRLTWVLFA